MKKFTVDRLEENKAVLECENGDIISLEKSVLPKKLLRAIFYTLKRAVIF